jgi:hypothetical protein
MYLLSLFTASGAANFKNDELLQTFLIKRLLSLDPKRVRKFLCVYRVSGSSLSLGLRWVRQPGELSDKPASESEPTELQQGGRATTLYRFRRRAWNDERLSETVRRAYGREIEGGGRRSRRPRFLRRTRKSARIPIRPTISPPVNDAESAPRARCSFFARSAQRGLNGLCRRTALVALAGAASDTNSFAGDPRRRVGSEKDGHGGDIPRFA